MLLLYASNYPTVTIVYLDHSCILKKVIPSILKNTDLTQTFIPQNNEKSTLVVNRHGFINVLIKANTNLNTVN